MDNNLYDMIFKRKSFHIFRDVGDEHLTDEELSTYTWFDLYLPRDENRFLGGDTISVCLGDENIYIFTDKVIVLPLVAYIRDIDGNLLARRIIKYPYNYKINSYNVIEKDETRYMEAVKNVKKLGLENKITLLYKDALDVSLNNNYDCILQGRGNVSWSNTSRKSFSIRFKERIPLINGLGHKNYNLIGNAFDRSLIKNYMFFNLADDLGIKYEPDFCNLILFINGKYNGIYTLTTKLSVDKYRINLDTDDMLFKIDAPTGDVMIPYKSNTWVCDDTESPMFELLYPKNPTPEQIKFAQDTFQKMIDAIEDTESPDFLNCIDLFSLAQYYIIQELSMNYDAHQRSVYAYYHNGKIYFGPVWDMDFTLGRRFKKYDMYWFFECKPYVKNVGLYRALFEHPEFVAEVKQLWSKDYGYCENIVADVEKYINNIAKDAYFNYALTPNGYDQGVLHYNDSSYESYAISILNFYKLRLQYLDAMLSY